MNQALCCARCNEVIIKGTPDGLKVRSKVTIIKSTGAFAVCRGCGEEVPIPVTLDVSMAKSLAQEKKLKLYVPIRK